MTNNNIFPLAKFVLPWGLMASLSMVLGLFMLLGVGAYGEQVVQTNVSCQVGEPILKDTIRVKLVCDGANGRFDTQLRQTDMVMAVLQEQVKEIRCSIRRNGGTEDCSKL